MTADTIELEIGFDDTRFRAAADAAWNWLLALHPVPQGGLAAWRGVSGLLIWVDLTGRPVAGCDGLGDYRAEHYLLAGGECAPHAYNECSDEPVDNRYCECLWPPDHPIHHPQRTYPAIAAIGLIDRWGYDMAMYFLAGGR